MVSYTVRVDQVADDTHTHNTAVLTKRNLSCAAFHALNVTDSVLKHKFLNEGKLEAVQRKMLRQGDMDKTHQKHNAGKGILNLHQSYLLLLLRL